MILLLSIQQYKQKIAENIKSSRKTLGYTQRELSESSGVALATLRKFEQQGIISLESLLKIMLVLGDIEKIVIATEPKKNNFKNMQQILDSNK